MARPPLAATAALAAGPDELEAEFYEALQRADIERLMAVWADDDEIACVHPGGDRIIGPAAIRTSFEAIFANGGIPVQARRVNRLQHLGCVLHHVVEQVRVDTPSGRQAVAVLATNVYVQTPLGWRLAAHHASPGTAPAAATPPPRGDAPTTLH